MPTIVTGNVRLAAMATLSSHRITYAASTEAFTTQTATSAITPRAATCVGGNYSLIPILYYMTLAERDRFLRFRQLRTAS